MNEKAVTRSARAGPHCARAGSPRAPIVSRAGRKAHAGPREPCIIQRACLEAGGSEERGRGADREEEEGSVALQKPLNVSRVTGCRHRHRRRGLHPPCCRLPRLSSTSCRPVLRQRYATFICLSRRRRQSKQEKKKKKKYQSAGQLRLPPLKK